MSTYTLSTLPYNTAIPREDRTAANDPNGNPDNYNRVARLLWNFFKVEHDKDGDHKSDFLASSAQIAVGSYTGNATDDRDISVSFTPYVVMIWSEQTDAHFTPLSPLVWSSYLYNVVETGKAVTASFDIPDPVYENLIQVVAGSSVFQIGDDDLVNKNGETFYYFIANLSGL
jgi:hypothetical protein